MKKAYDEASVIRSLKKKSSIRIMHNKVIEITKDATDVGCGSWGKIDYLCKVHGYFYRFVKAVIKTKSDDSSYGSNKSTKREKKLNMVSMTKKAMQKAKTI